MSWEGLRATLARIAKSNGGVSPEFSLLNVGDTITLLQQRDELITALKWSLDRIPHTGGEACHGCVISNTLKPLLARVEDGSGQSTEPPPYDVVFTTPDGIHDVPAPSGECANCKRPALALNMEGWCLDCFSAASR